MRIFVLRARKGPTIPGNVEQNMGGYNHFEVIAHTVVSSLFVAKNLRNDVILHIVNEGPPDPPKVITFDSQQFLQFPGFDERSVMSVIKRALAHSMDLQKDETRSVDPGLHVSRKSFEHLVRDLSGKYPTFMLDKKGKDIRDTVFSEHSCFLLTDHITMQKKTYHLLRRLKVEKLSLGPRMVFAAHSIIIVHNELDRREIEMG